MGPDQDTLDPISAPYRVLIVVESELSGFRTYVG
jgi:hypothetical protein